MLKSWFSSLSGKVFGSSTGNDEQEDVNSSTGTCVDSGVKEGSSKALIDDGLPTSDNSAITGKNAESVVKAGSHYNSNSSLDYTTCSESEEDQPKDNSKCSIKEAKGVQRKLDDHDIDSKGVCMPITKTRTSASGDTKAVSNDGLVATSNCNNSALGNRQSDEEYSVVSVHSSEGHMKEDASLTQKVKNEEEVLSCDKSNYGETKDGAMPAKNEDVGQCSPELEIQGVCIGMREDVSLTEIEQGIDVAETVSDASVQDISGWIALDTSGNRMGDGHGMEVIKIAGKLHSDDEGSQTTAVESTMRETLVTNTTPVKPAVGKDEGAGMNITMTTIGGSPTTVINLSGEIPDGHADSEGQPLVICNDNDAYPSPDKASKEENAGFGVVAVNDHSSDQMSNGQQKLSDTEASTHVDKEAVASYVVHCIDEAVTRAEQNRKSVTPEENMTRRDNINQNARHDGKREDFLDYCKYKTKTGHIMEPKKLVYGLGHIKKVDFVDIEDVIRGQYAIAAKRNLKAWVKDLRFYAEILCSPDWIDDNIPNLNARGDRKGRKSDRRRKKTTDNLAAAANSSKMCRDVRLLTDSSIQIVRENAMGDQNKAEKAAAVDSSNKKTDSEKVETASTEESTSKQTDSKKVETASTEDSSNKKTDSEKVEAAATEDSTNKEVDSEKVEAATTEDSTNKQTDLEKVETAATEESTSKQTDLEKVETAATEESTSKQTDLEKVETAATEESTSKQADSKKVETASTEESTSKQTDSEKVETFATEESTSKQTDLEQLEKAASKESTSKCKVQVDSKYIEIETTLESAEETILQKTCTHDQNNEIHLQEENAVQSSTTIALEHENDIAVEVAVGEWDQVEKSTKKAEIGASFIILESGAQQVRKSAGTAESEEQDQVWESVRTAESREHNQPENFAEATENIEKNVAAEQKPSSNIKQSQNVKQIDQRTKRTEDKLVEVQDHTVKGDAATYCKKKGDKTSKNSKERQTKAVMLENKSHDGDAAPSVPKGKKSKKSKSKSKTMKDKIQEESRKNIDKKKDAKAKQKDDDAVEVKTENKSSGSVLSVLGEQDIVEDLISSFVSSIVDNVLLEEYESDTKTEVSDSNRPTEVLSTAICDEQTQYYIPGMSHTESQDCSTSNVNSNNLSENLASSAHVLHNVLEGNIATVDGYEVQFMDISEGFQQEVIIPSTSSVEKDQINLSENNLVTNETGTDTFIDPAIIYQVKCFNGGELIDLNPPDLGVEMDLASATTGLQQMLRISPEPEAYEQIEGSPMTELSPAQGFEGSDNLDLKAELPIINPEVVEQATDPDIHLVTHLLAGDTEGRGQVEYDPNTVSNECSTQIIELTGFQDIEENISQLVLDQLQEVIPTAAGNGYGEDRALLDLVQENDFNDLAENDLLETDSQTDGAGESLVEDLSIEDQHAIATGQPLCSQNSHIAVDIDALNAIDINGIHDLENQSPEFPDSLLCELGVNGLETVANGIIDLGVEVSSNVGGASQIPVIVSQRPEDGGDERALSDSFLLSNDNTEGQCGLIEIKMNVDLGEEKKLDKGAETMLENQENISPETGNNLDLGIEK